MLSSKATEQKTAISDTKRNAAWLKDKATEILKINFGTQAVTEQQIEGYVDFFLQMHITQLFDLSQKENLLKTLLNKLAKDANEQKSMLNTLSFMEKLISELFEQEEFVLFKHTENQQYNLATKKPSLTFMKEYTTYYSKLLELFISEKIEKEPAYQKSVKMNQVFKLLLKEDYEAAEIIFETIRSLVSPTIYKIILSKIIDAKVHLIITNKIPDAMPIDDVIELMSTARKEFGKGKHEEALANFGATISFYYYNIKSIFIVERSKVGLPKNAFEDSKIKHFIEKLFDAKLLALNTKLSQLPTQLDTTKDTDVMLLASKKIALTAIIIIETDLLLEMIASTSGKAQTQDNEILKLFHYLNRFYKCLNEFIKKQSTPSKADSLTLRKFLASECLLKGQKSLLNSQHPEALKWFKEAYQHHSNEISNRLLRRTDVINKEISNESSLKHEQEMRNRLCLALTKPKKEKKQLEESKAIVIIEKLPTPKAKTSIISEEKMAEKTLSVLLPTHPLILFSSNNPTVKEPLKEIELTLTEEEKTELNKFANNEFCKIHLLRSWLKTLFNVNNLPFIKQSFEKLYDSDMFNQFFPVINKGKADKYVEWIKELLEPSKLFNIKDPLALLYFALTMTQTECSIKDISTEIIAGQLHSLGGFLINEYIFFDESERATTISYKLKELLPWVVNSLKEFNDSVAVNLNTAVLTRV